MFYIINKSQSTSSCTGTCYKIIVDALVFCREVMSKLARVYFLYLHILHMYVYFNSHLPMKGISQMRSILILLNIYLMRKRMSIPICMPIQQMQHVAHMRSTAYKKLKRCKIHFLKLNYVNMCACFCRRVIRIFEYIVY